MGRIATIGLVLLGGGSVVVIAVAGLAILFGSLNGLHNTYSDDYHNGEINMKALPLSEMGFAQQTVTFHIFPEEANTLVTLTPTDRSGLQVAYTDNRSEVSFVVIPTREYTVEIPEHKTSWKVVPGQPRYNITMWECCRCPTLF